MSNRGRPPKLAGQEEIVIAMYLGGATIGDLEEHFGCSDTPIIRILDEAGIERRRGRPPGRGSAPRQPIAQVETISGVEDLYDPPGRPPVATVRAPEAPAETETTEERPKVRVPSVGPRASRRVMDEVFRRDGYRCRMCGSTTRLTVEFAIPPDRGGNARNINDLRTVCAPCTTSPVKDAPEAGQEKKGLLSRILGR